MTNDIVANHSRITKSSWKRRCGYCLFFLILFVLIGLRNLKPLVYPTLYAEDGKWLGQILTKGFWDAALHGRTEFPVLGLTSLLFTALMLVKVFFANNLTYLPLAVFYVSTAFIATMAYLSFRLAPTYLSTLSKLTLVAAIVLMPVGIDGNEVFGRILNLGFEFPVFQLILIIRMLEFRPKTFELFFIALFLLASGLTFPVCMVFNLIGMCVFVIRYLWEPKFHRNKIDLTYALLLLTVTVLSILPLGATAFTSKGGADMPYTPSGLIDFALGRCLLYPFVHSIYEKMNDNIVLWTAGPLLVIMLLGSLKVIFGRSPRRYVTLLIGGAWLSYFLATIILRSGFTSIYGQYTNTFPDRYFYGLNVLFLFFIVYLAESLPRMRSQFSWNSAIPLAVLIALGTGIEKKFELIQPQLDWGSLGTFQYTVCNEITNGKPLPIDTNSTVFAVPIYPILDGFGWQFQASKDDFKFIGSMDCQKVLNDKHKQPF